MLFLTAVVCQASAAQVFESADTQSVLMELYVSEGCSSCPSAQKWAGDFVDDPRLWKDIVPVVFHVDYWDGLGWKDPFATKAATERQYRYKEEGKLGSVYTPGFVLNGREWRGWFKNEDVPAGRSKIGQLKAQLEAGRLNVTFDKPLAGSELNVAVLGFGFDIDIKAGENRNRKIREDFVVLAHETHLSDNGQWSVPLPEYKDRGAARTAIALWVNHQGHLPPLQATGGWIK